MNPTLQRPNSQSVLERNPISLSTWEETSARVMQEGSETKIGRSSGVWPQQTQGNMSEE